MSTDKRKPIPSPKHTLDDVLKALQDLVRNELADENVGHGRPARAAPRARDHFADEGTTTPASSALQAKPSLDTTATRTTVAAQADTDVAFAATPPATHAVDNDKARIDFAAVADRDRDHASHVGGNAGGANDGAADPADLGAELPSLFVDDPAADTTDAHEHVDTARANCDDGVAKDATDATRSRPEQTSINWDDIPVLNEVVDLPTRAAAAVPNARTVAVRVVARLNIELRQAGTAPLDPAIIDRLERLLREALDPNAAAIEQ